LKGSDYTDERPHRVAHPADGRIVTTGTLIHGRSSQRRSQEFVLWCTPEARRAEIRGRRPTAGEEFLGRGLANQIRIGPDEPFQRYGHSKLCKTAVGRDLGFGPTGNSAIRSADLENPTWDQTRSRSDDPFRRYGRSKFSKMAASRHLGFGPTGSRSIRSAVSENPTLEPNMKWIG